MGEEILKKFAGFRSPNYTQVPDEIMDQLLPLLSGAELKVLLYICRRTFGFKKDSDAISLSQISSGIKTRDGRVLDIGTGLSKRHVQRAIKRLEELNAVRVLRSLDADNVNEMNVFTLNFIDGGVGTKSPYGRDIVVMGVGTPVSTTINSKQDKEYNVNVGLIKNGKKGDDNDNDEFDVDANLLYQIIDYTGDNNPRSKGTFRKVIQRLGKGTTDRILGITKEAVQSGTVSRTKSAGYFVGVANNIAEERGIDLGFKNGAQKDKIAIANLKAQVGNIGTVRNFKSSRDDAE